MSGELDLVCSLLREQLSRAHRPISHQRLARAINVKSLPLVMKALRRLQKDHVASPKASGWIWTGARPGSEQRPGSSLTEEPREEDLGADNEEPGDRPPERHARDRPRDSRVLGKRWSTFRNLCRYYAECVRIQEKARLQVYAEKEGKDFVCLDRGVDWQGLAAGQSCPVPLDHEQLLFARKAIGGGGHPRWFLGGPVEIFRAEKRDDDGHYIAVRPILHVQVVPELRDNELWLHPTGTFQVDSGWLEGRCRTPDARNELLAAVGLNDGILTSQGEGREANLAIRDFRDAWRSLWLGYRDWWEEAGDLQDLRSDPPLHDIKHHGIYNRAVLVRGPRLQFSKSLIDELLQIADQVPDAELDRTALRALFPHDPPPAPPGDGRPEEAPEPRIRGEIQFLNPEQREAVARSALDPLVVLTGPPGTGKSATVAHVMIDHALRRRSVLFASRNHQAIEAVEPRLNALVEPEFLVLRPSRKHGDARQTDWELALTQMLARPRHGDASARWEADREELEALLDRRDTILGQLGRLAEAGVELARVEAELEPALAELSTDLTGRAWRPDHEAPDPEELQRLLADLEEWQSRHDAPGLLGMLRRTWQALRRCLGADPAHGLRGNARALLQRIAAAAGLQPPAPPHTTADLRWDIGQLRGCEGFVVAHALCCAATTLRSEIESLPPRSELDAALDSTQADLQAQTTAALKTLAETAGSNISPEDRQRFAEIRAGLENHKGSASSGKFDRAFKAALPELLKHFPLWAISNLSARRAAGLRPAVFDLLIVDEASQCDIASVVPLMFRAKRLLAVGDPMQLKHIHQGPAATDRMLRGQHGVLAEVELERFSMRTVSFYELASSSRHLASPLQLRAHYRCHPDIAQFCNEQFYSGTLRIMTSRRGLRGLPGSAATLRGCSWREAQGPIERAASGCHMPSVTEATLDELRRLADAGYEGTVGVVTPFKVQADRIRDEATRRIDEAVRARWQFLAHTVDGFQGDERDMILFALPGGAAMPQGSRGFLASTPNRFNVAISRARIGLRVVGNPDWARSCGIPYITRLLEACERSTSQPFTRRDDLIGPVWEPRFAEALRAAGLAFEQQYQACGFYLDFALLNEERKLAVEVDGETWHRDADGQLREEDRARDFVLRTDGWQVLRFWVYELRDDLDGCVEQVRAAL